jgi:predicted transcriptional regulator
MARRHDAIWIHLSRLAPSTAARAFGLRRLRFLSTLAARRIRFSLRLLSDESILIPMLTTLNPAPQTATIESVVSVLLVSSRVRE